LGGGRRGILAGMALVSSTAPTAAPTVKDALAPLALRIHECGELTELEQAIVAFRHAHLALGARTG
jgi:hypothetical protein